MRSSLSVRKGHIDSRTSSKTISRSLTLPCYQLLQFQQSSMFSHTICHSYGSQQQSHTFLYRARWRVPLLNRYASTYFKEQSRHCYPWLRFLQGHQVKGHPRNKTKLQREGTNMYMFFKLLNKFFKPQNSKFNSVNTIIVDFRQYAISQSGLELIMYLLATAQSTREFFVMPIDDNMIDSPSIRRQLQIPVSSLS